MVVYNNDCWPTTGGIFLRTRVAKISIPSSAYCVFVLRNFSLPPLPLARRFPTARFCSVYRRMERTEEGQEEEEEKEKGIQVVAGVGWLFVLDERSRSGVS